MKTPSIFNIHVLFVLLCFALIPTMGDQSQTVGWKADPDGRGTFTLVSTCVLTLIICVYSAMHLNVPPYGESKTQLWIRNIKWALLGIFGPELVVFIAWKQCQSAKTIEEKSKASAHNGTPTEQNVDAKRCMNMESLGLHTYTEKSRPSWTTVHGFYAGMGGFTFPLRSLTADLDTSTFSAECKRLTLTAKGVALLAECKVLPDIEKEYLKDKSKSDGLSKLIACVQAAWMIVQVIGRLSFGLQVTLLEVNTVGHVFCAFIIYVLWWHKPRQVLEPIVLEGEWTGPLCAYMYMSSRLSGPRSGNRLVTGENAVEPEISTLAYFPERSCKDQPNIQDHGHNITIHGSPSDGGSRSEQRPLAEFSTLDGSPAGAFKQRMMILDDAGGSQLVSRRDSPDESPEDHTGQVQRWALAAEAVRKYSAIRHRFSAIHRIGVLDASTAGFQQIEPEELVQESCSNWSTSNLVSGDFGLVMGIILWFASMAFGGIHLAAWHSYFPSATERWLWRCSAIYMMWSGLVWCLINLIAKMSKSVDDYWNGLRLPYPPFARSIPLVVVCFICGSLYAFARILLVLEAFISIRRLPSSAYETPEWTQIFPHF